MLLIRTKITKRSPYGVQRDTFARQGVVGRGLGHDDTAQHGVIDDLTLPSIVQLT